MSLYNVLSTRAFKRLYYGSDDSATDLTDDILKRYLELPRWKESLNVLNETDERMLQNARTTIQAVESNYSFATLSGVVSCIHEVTTEITLEFVPRVINISAGQYKKIDGTFAPLGRGSVGFKIDDDLKKIIDDKGVFTARYTGGYTGLLHNYGELYAVLYTVGRAIYEQKADQSPFSVTSDHLINNFSYALP